VLIVLPSLVSGIGLAFILAGIFIDHTLLRNICFAIGATLFWLDFFISMAILRRSIRSIDSRLTALEQRRTH